MRNIFVFILISITLSSCLTGGFDENEQLDEMNKQLAKTPQVESVKVNGEEVQRNRLSRRVVEARIGDALEFDVLLKSGKGATLEELEFERVYYYGEDFQEDPQPVDPETNGVYELSGNQFQFTYNYTVPEEDDDGFHFDPGYTIQLYFRARNSLGNYGYRAIEVLIVE